MPESRAQLNNVTVYVAPEDFDTTRLFYGTVLGGEPVFEEPGHIVCFSAGPDRTLCVHEAGELGRGAGDIEVIFWVDDLEELRKHLGVDVPWRELRGRAVEVRDPSGWLLGFQERPSGSTR